MCVSLVSLDAAVRFCLRCPVLLAALGDSPLALRARRANSGAAADTCGLLYRGAVSSCLFSFCGSFIWGHPGGCDLAQPPCKQPGGISVAWGKGNLFAVGRRRLHRFLILVGQGAAPKQGWQHHGQTQLHASLAWAPSTAACCRGTASALRHAHITVPRGSG